MATGTATVIVLTAGGMTFVNQWYQTKHIDWKVPVATVILAAGIDVFSNLDPAAATMIALLILLGAASTKFNDKSPIDMISGLVQSQPQKRKTS